MAPPPPIVHGIPTDGSFFEVGSLLIDSGDSSYLICTATLIQDDVVITAGHCAQQINAQLTDHQVVLFSVLEHIDLNTSVYTDSVLIRDAIIHPDFDSYLNNDIALVFLEESIDQPVARMSVAVPDVSWQNNPFTFVGVGNTSENADDEGTKQKTRCWENHTVLVLEEGSQICLKTYFPNIWAISPNSWEIIFQKS